jgi:hypothetical protein
MMERNVIYSSLYIVMHASREVARMLLHAEYRWRRHGTLLNPSSQIVKLLHIFLYIDI